MNFVDKYYWIINHPKITSRYKPQASIDLYPQMVNPTNNTVEKDISLNTKPEWWVELSMANPEYDPSNQDTLTTMHDWRLDCGGDTSEEAIEKLYDNVLGYYGDYE